MHNDFFAALDLPQWFPDEIFYSLTCRYHRLSCNSKVKSTLKQLFGQPQLGYQHDFPSGLEAFVRRTDAALGTQKQIIREHTILPFYLPLRKPIQAEELVASFEVGEISSLKYKLGILTSRFRAHHPLKACTECMQEDLANYSVRYWHRSHQFPGVWICPVHRTILHEANVKANGVGRFQFYLPQESILESPSTIWTAIGKKSSHTEFLSTLAECSIELAKLPSDFHFAPDTLHATYATALSNLNLVTKEGNLRLKEAVQRFANHIAPLKIIPELDLQKQGTADLYTQLGRILRPARTGTHPLRHTLLITWLFGRWEYFWNSYNATTNSVVAPTKDFQVSIIQPVPDASGLVSLVQSGTSVTRAAHELGMDVSTAMSMLAQQGITTNRRPKQLRGTLLNAVVEDIKTGKDIRHIATRHGLSVTTVSRTRGNTIGLHYAWADARNKMQQTSMREIWLMALTEYPGLGRKLLRAHVPATYMWLYRHDRGWLDKNQPEKNSYATHLSAIRWDERDAALSQQVRKVVLSLSKTTERKRIHLWQIYQRIPELKAKLGVLDRLPQTKRLLENVIGEGKYSASPSLNCAVVK